MSTSSGEADKSNKTNNIILKLKVKAQKSDLSSWQIVEKKRKNENHLVICHCWYAYSEIIEL